VPFGSGLNNLKILDIKNRIDNSLRKPNLLDTIPDTTDRIPIMPFQNTGSHFKGMEANALSPKQFQPKNAIGGDHRYKQVATKDHIEIRQFLEDPFKKNFLSFETKKEQRLAERLYRKKEKT
jgi:hypothetical protein